MTPYAGVLLAAEVSAEKKAELQERHGWLNPFQLGREIERQKSRLKRADYWPHESATGVG